MNKLLNPAFLGVVLGIALVLWFGFSHYENTKNERLPLQLQKEIINLQKQLPINVNNEYSLENFELKRNSVTVEFKFLKQFNIDIPKYEIEARSNSLICDWRKMQFGNIPGVKNFIIKDLNDNEIASISNTIEICSIPKNQMKFNT